MNAYWAMTVHAISLMEPGPTSRTLTRALPLLEELERASSSCSLRFKSKIEGALKPMPLLFDLNLNCASLNCDGLCPYVVPIFCSNLLN